MIPGHPQGEPTFSASTAADRDLPPIPFTLTGVYAPGKTGPDGATEWSERYEACGVIPMAANASLTEAWVRDDATGRRQVNPGAVVSFLRDALPESEARRFMELVYDKNRLVKLETLAEVVEYLGGRYTGRPTGAPASSSGGGAPTAAGAQAGAPWPPSLP